MPKALKIITIKNKDEEKLLRQKSQNITTEEIKTPQFQEFLDNLLYTAQHSEEQGNVPAGGIAAVQVGEHKNYHKGGLFKCTRYFRECYKISKGKN